MSTYTDNYALVKLDDTDYYNIADYNENMDVIDSLMTETEEAHKKISEKIGEPSDTGTKTVFGKLNSGSSLVKSIQTVTFDVNANSGTHNKTLDTPVDPNRCLVLTDRMYQKCTETIRIQYTLNENSISFSATYAENSAICVQFQIIEFY